MQCHDFYLRRGRQRNTLQHVTVQCTPLFHCLCYKSHVLGGEPILKYDYKFIDGQGGLHRSGSVTTVYQ
ncbi:hypothetical protein SFRURICE_004315 [Spodoptera frugiperda]|uniref:SFRICE_013520 n=1 Tax=Spodoptera frugiperda TaxID=7108 RepID=A0A2H1VXG3_SPOFR|nr:hypothetical protein SFRURICE_004315 [Spodoptera frugiperda]